MKEDIQLLEDLRPWDCEVFPKSKTICYGGGGGFSLPKLPTPNLNFINKGLDATVGNVGRGLDQIGKPLAQGMADLGTPNIPMPNLEQVTEGLDHNLKQGANALGAIGKTGEGLVKGVMGLFGGGGGGGAMSGGGVMGGPGGRVLGDTMGRDIAKKKTGMSRKKTLLTG
tara:strand:+ start:593 stop:1099 length:507 start_codon:yes stop_codon:yes gene_type:complete